MRTEEPRPVRLEDYRPPDWLIDTVALDVCLHPTASTVRATLKIKPNAGATPSPLVLDGEDLKLHSLALDGKPLAAGSYVAAPDRLTIAQVPNRPFTLEIETLAIDGPLSRRSDLLHAMRGGRFPPHHLFPRPAGCDGGLHDPHRSR
jgi:aminopeptidase N